MQSTKCKLTVKTQWILLCKQLLRFGARNCDGGEVIIMVGVSNTVWQLTASLICTHCMCNHTGIDKFAQEARSYTSILNAAQPIVASS